MNKMYYSELSLNGHFSKTDTSLRRTSRLVPVVYTLFHYNQTLCKTDTFLRRTTDTFQGRKGSKYSPERTDNGLINRMG